METNNSDMLTPKNFESFVTVASRGLYGKDFIFQSDTRLIPVFSSISASVIPLIF